FFFFQAEDGIRDRNVTGVQTCALPISSRKPVKVQILLARDWYSKPNQKFPTVWALDGLRAREDESGWTLSTNIANFYADKNVNRSEERRVGKERRQER